MKTVITLTIEHKSPIPDLLDKVAGRAYTIDGVGDVTASVEAQVEAVPFGWVKQIEIDQAKRTGGSMNVWLKKYDCDVQVFLKP